MNDYKLQPSRQMERGDWYWINKAVIKQYAPKIGTTGIAVYNYLACLADSHQTCFPSHGHIAKVLDCSRTTVIKTIHMLKEHGLISIERSSRYPQVYRLLAVGCTVFSPKVSNPPSFPCSDSGH